MSVDASAVRSIDRVHGALLLAMCAGAALANFVIMPTLPFFALGLGVGPVAIGVMFAASAVTQLLLAPVWGTLADRFGTGRLLVIVPLISVAANLTLAFSHAYPTMLVARILAGGGASVSVLAQTRVVAAVDGEARTVLVGRLTAVQGVGTIAGPALASLVVPYGIGAVGAVAAGASLLVAVLATLLPPEETGAGSNRRPAFSAVRTLLSIPRLRALAVVGMLGWLCFSGYGTVLPLFLHRRFGLTSTSFGYLVTVSGIVALVVRGLLLGWFVRRFGEPLLLVAGALAISGSMALAALLPTVWLTPVLPMTYALGAGLLFPCLVTMISRTAPQGTAGLAVGGSATLSGIGTVLGPVLGGALFASLPHGVFGLGSAAFASVAVVAALATLSSPGKAQVSQ
jgi:MFS transporter, DHA1 family, tetracycline resistance protein